MCDAIVDWSCSKMSKETFRLITKHDHLYISFKNALSVGFMWVVDGNRHRTIEYIFINYTLNNKYVL